MFQEGSGSHFLSFLVPFGGPSGRPLGSLFDSCGHPGGPIIEKNDVSESVCSRARFVI
jgi:hypothetical protein